ncbi:MAG: glycosyltransferase [Bacteroidia bacterium]|nr:glycosyltransferase [Bacteroidia bacterium]
MNGERDPRPLVLFTSGFPYGKVEQFLELEIHYLAATFREVHLIPLAAPAGEARSVPDNCRVHALSLDEPFSGKALLRRHGRQLAAAWLREVLLSPHPQVYLREFRRNVYHLLNSYQQALRLEAFLETQCQGPFLAYSYWWNYWPTLLALIHRRGRLQFDFFTRALGYDFDLRQTSKAYFPFRSIELEEAVRIFPISGFGERTIGSAYPKFRHKLERHYLSVEDRGINPGPSADGIFRVCSCSHLIPLKRVHLIAEVLERLPFEVHWTHIGFGELETELRARIAALPPRVKARITGFWPNQSILDFYRNEPADLFIHVSEMEGGAPVAIQEACSFGIPAIGTEADAIPEIVNEHTGFRIPRDFDPQAVADLITAYRSRPDQAAFRQGVRDYWKAHFHAPVVYGRFAQRLTQL